jgi:hypothetical protein
MHIFPQAYKLKWSKNNSIGNRLDIYIERYPEDINKQI